jgi:ferric-dicitrate binding protein FerR (iron transport regulator)
MSKADLIYKVLSGVASDVEKQELERWVAGSEANRQEYKDLELLYRLSRVRRDVLEDSRYYERLERIRRTARARFNRKVRTRQAYCLAGALACVGLAYFIAIHAVIDFRPASLQFQDQALQEVLELVERTYGIEVRVEQSALASCRFTGTFYRVDQPDDVIRSISRAVSAHVVAIGPRKYRLLGGGC